MASDELETTATDERIYEPQQGERQLTLRAVVVGCLLGGLVTGMNLYLGLKIGWSVGGSLMAAILGFAAFRVFAPQSGFGVMETNITQTSGSGAGTMASAGGFLAPIPALFMLGYDIAWWQLLLWAWSIAYLGVMFAVPLRRQYVVEEKLRFPTGTATANTIVAMFAEAGEAVAKARVLLWTAAIAFAFILGSHFWGKLEIEYWGDLGKIPLDYWFGGVFALASAWSFKLYVGPMLFGAGGLMGPRIGISLLLGAIAGWAVLGPYAQSQGWAPADPMLYHQVPDAWWGPMPHEFGEWGPRGWILWPGVAIMVADALMSLLLSWKTFVRAFKRPVVRAGDEFGPQTDTEAIPNRWWVTGLAMASTTTILVAWFAFGIPAYLSIVAILMSAVLANVAVRSTGETDINPIGGMGKVTQLAYGFLSPSMSTNLLSAGITGAGASQAGDMMHDLKAGHLLGASPRNQFKAQLFGIFVGVLFTVPLFFLFKEAYTIGEAGGPLPAPAAHAWRAMAEVLSKGLGFLPEGAMEAAAGGLVFGALFPILRKLFPRIAPYTPSGLAFGIAFIVPAFYPVTMFFGSMALVIWRKTNKEQCDRFLFAVASGLIAGEGLGGIVNAVMTVVENLT